MVGGCGEGTASIEVVNRKIKIMIRNCGYNSRLLPFFTAKMQYCKNDVLAWKSNQ